MGEGLPRKCGIGKRRRFRDNRADSLDEGASIQRLTDVASSSVDRNKSKDGKLFMLVGLSRPLSSQICHDRVHSTASLPKRQQQHVTNRQKNSRKRARRRRGMLESGDDYQTAIFRADLDLKTEPSNMDVKSDNLIPRNRRPVRLKSIARRSNNDCLEEKKPCDSDSAEKLYAGVYRVEFTQSKYVWHGSTWCVSSAESEVSKMLRRGRHPHMGMQRAFNRGERKFLVTVVDRMGMFTEFPMAEEDRVRTFEKSGRKGKGRCVKQGRVMDSNRVEESLARRVESIHNQFVKKRVRFTLRSWRRTRLLPAFSALRNQMERLRATENCAAATEIQRFVRGKAARHLSERLRRRRAQTRIAALARSRIAIRRVAALRCNTMQNECAMMVQCAYRGRKARKRLHAALKIRELDDAAITVQRNFRAYLACRTGRRILFARRRHLAAISVTQFFRICGAKVQIWALRRERAALRVQTRWRCRKGQIGAQLIRAHKREQEAAATRLQSRVRMRAARRRTRAIVREREERAAVRIQARWRSRKQQLGLFLIKCERDRCARIVQRFYRAYAVCIMVNQRRRLVAAKRIQRCARNFRQRRCSAATRIQRARRKQIIRRNRRAAVIQIQRVARGAAARVRMSGLNANAVRIQRAYRTHAARAMLSALKARRKRLEGMPLCDECNDEVCGVVCRACQGKFCTSCMGVIHSVLRMHETMHKEGRQDIIFKVSWTKEHVHAGEVIQRAYRSRNARIIMLAKRAGRMQKEHAVMMARLRWRMNTRRGVACRQIQAVARGFLARLKIRRQHAAATQIQRGARGMAARRALATAKRSSTMIQAAARGRAQRLLYAKQRHACIQLQAFFRRVFGRTWFLHVRNCAVAIQSAARGSIARHAYKRQRDAVRKIQAATRGHFGRQELKHRQHSATRLQAWFRARGARADWLARRRAVIKLQRRWRIRLAVCELRSRQTRLARLCLIQANARERSAARIQRSFRAWRELRHAVLRVQRSWRKRQGKYTAFLVRVGRSAAAARERGLETPWSKQWDTYGERWYYFNHETLECAHSAPQAYLLAVFEKKNRQAMGQEEERMLRVLEYEAHMTEEERANQREHWEVHVDPHSGAKYYQNHLLQVTQWERPYTLGPDPDEPIWETHIHPVSNRAWYYNRLTGKSTWRRPVEELGREWTEYFDYELKKSYWYSCVTAETTYSKPTEVLEDELGARLEAAGKSPEQQVDFEQIIEARQVDHAQALEDDSYRQWNTALDADAKTYYYLYNSFTGNTEDITYEKPETLMQEWEKWDEYFSLPDDKAYYVHKKSGMTTWKKPW